MCVCVCVCVCVCKDGQAEERNGGEIKMGEQKIRGDQKVFEELCNELQRHVIL